MKSTIFNTNKLYTVTFAHNKNKIVRVLNSKTDSLNLIHEPLGKS